LFEFAFHYAAVPIPSFAFNDGMYRATWTRETFAPRSACSRKSLEAAMVNKIISAEFACAGESIATLFQ
jgi:hypothetical protein